MFATKTDIEARTAFSKTDKLILCQPAETPKPPCNASPLITDDPSHSSASLSTRITIPSLFTVGATYHIFIPFFGNSRLYILHPPPNPLLSPTIIHLPPEYIFYPSSILLSISIMYPDLYIHFYLLSNSNSASDQQVLAPKL